MAGFFILEVEIIKSGKGDGLMTRTELDALWETALGKMKGLLADKMQSLDELEPYLQVKDTLLVFARTLKNHGFEVHLLYEFVSDSCIGYENIVLQFLEERVLDILQSEKYEPMAVRNANGYEEEVLNFELRDASINVDYPTTVPFSSSVPRLCRSIRVFCAEQYLYSKGLPDGAMVSQKAVDRALVDLINVKLNEMISDTGTHLLPDRALEMSIFLFLDCEPCSWCIPKERHHTHL